MKIRGKEVRVSPRAERVFDVAKKILGVVAILLGLAGLVFPILPGWLLIFVGLELLGIQIVFFEKIKEYVRAKLKKVK